MSIRVVSVTVVLVVLAAVVAVTVRGRSSTEGASDRRAQDAGRRFLETYVATDGRVVRRDQGGDTVSEGQAYGMMIAVALGDEDAFRQIWWWTRTRLQRGDGLLSYRWADGSVTDPSPAADADLDAAHALLLAADRFDDSVLADDALQIAQGVLAEETLRVPVRARTAGAGAGNAGEGEATAASPDRVLLAGPWAQPQSRGTQRLVINPSYFSQRAYAALAAATDDRAWTELEASSYEVLRGLTDGGALPPDWAAVDMSGGIRPIGRPDKPDARPFHGLDAARVTIRVAASCEPRWQELAASAARIYPAPENLRTRLRLDGRPANEHRHPVMLVAAAAAAHAAGEASATRTLDAAERLERRHPSYYGAAWLALGRLWLEAPPNPCP
jgi:endoglucanase